MNGIVSGVAQEVALAGASCRIFPDAPSWDDLPTGAIGSLSFSDVEAGESVVRLACAQLRALGRRAVLAPMDGDTWHTYRVITESDGSSPFLMEPVSGLADLRSLRQAGFSEVAQYVSTCARTERYPEAPPTVSGVAVEAWNGGNVEAVLEQLFQLSLRAFARNPFYRPIDRSEFGKIYRPLLPHLDSRLVLLARDENADVCGYALAFPDLLERPSPTTVVTKTLVSLRPGTGRLLLAEVRRRARLLGYKRLIHALMHVDNRSLVLSREQGGAVFRRYALMGLRLG